MTAHILQIDEQLVSVLVKSTREGLTMAKLKPVPVGVGKTLHSHGNVSSIVGFVGPVSGSMIISTFEECACFMAGSMLGEPLPQLDNQVLDGLCEIANIIAGQAKAVLSATEYRFDRISVPSVIVGDSHFISQYRGMTTVSVEFELPEMPVKPGDRGMFTVSLSLMKV